jgi:hypothetical protein
MALTKRFSDLDIEMATVLATKKQKYSEFSGTYNEVDNTSFLTWRIKVLNLLEMACGKESVHLQRFIKTEEPKSFRDSYETLVELGAVFRAAKEDYDGGYLNSVRNLVQAEVFENELEQATELHSAGYHSAAAVIAGVVLETTLRQLCLDRGITLGKLDKMNADLAKSGLYNLLVQKKITALADIRNSAAHGHSDQFKASDVSEMISYVSSFVAAQL